MKNVLIVSGHTDLQHNSFANKIIMEDLEQLLPQASFDYLDRLYPDYKIDVAAEQKKLVAADVIVLQFPIFWYSMPSLLAKWMEDVFEHGFSHGSSGKALTGKKLLLSFTSGSPADTYAKGAPQLYPVETMTTRFQQAANLCHMKYEGFVYTGGVSYSNRADKAKLAAMADAAHAHATRLVKKIQSF